MIFAPNLFGRPSRSQRPLPHGRPDGGVKYRGYSLDGEFYWRRVDDFGVRGGTLPFDDIDDHGFQLLASAMVVPEMLQVYAGRSKIFGEYGDPWDVRARRELVPLRATRSCAGTPR